MSWKKFHPTLVFFHRKKWIREKLSLLGQQKALVFLDKSKIMWAFLNDEQKYWMPVEKAQFYLYVFEYSGSSCLIIEKKENETHYYGMVDKFLVAYTKDYKEAIDSVKKYNNGRKINVFGVGEQLDHDCDKTMSFQKIVQKVLYKEKHNSNFNCEINDDLIYINEDHEQNFVQKDCFVKENIDDAFFHWFENVKNKVNYKRKYVLGALLTGILFFSIADIYCAYNGAQIKKELEHTMQKINKTTNIK